MKEQNELHTDICVIGGGPAGSVAACRLAQLGYEVCLVERGYYSTRQRYGESLLGSFFPLLRTLQLDGVIEEIPHVRVDEVLVRWGSDQIVHRKEPEPPDIVIDRRNLDQALLEHARRAGVKVLCPATARSPIHRSLCDWVIPIFLTERSIRIFASFVIEASGRHPLLPGRQKRYSVPTFALYGYWRDTPFKEQVMRVEAGEKGWYWCAPLPDGTVSALVCIDPKTLASSEGTKQLYLSLLHESRLVQPCLEGELMGQVVVTNATSYFAEHPVTEDSIKIGEAFLSVDPLSSSGVFNAVLSAVQACRVVNTLLRTPENNVAALEFYQKRQIELIHHHANNAGKFYVDQYRFQPGPFWKARTKNFDQSSKIQTKRIESPSVSWDTRVQLAPDIKYVDTPVIKGDFICWIPALTHPNLPRPVAYIGDIEIVPLLKTLIPGQTLHKIIEKWVRDIPLAEAYQILSEMLSKKVIIPCP